MQFCKKCGAIITPATNVCSSCGTVVGAENVSVSKNGLIIKLQKYKELLSENEELQSLIKPQSNFPSSPDTYKKRSFIKFFWPFLVIGVVSFYLVYMIATFIIAYSAATRSSEAVAASLMGDTFASFIVALIIAAVIIVFGIKVSKRKQEEFNSNADFMNREATERYNQGLANQRAIDLYQDNINKMYQFELLVPKEYRTSDKVGKIIEALKDDKAETVEEAISVIG